VSTVSHKIDDSPVWTDLLKTKHIYLRGRKIHVNNGKWALFWKDEWLGEKPIFMMVLVLFDWCSQKDIIVHQFLSLNGYIKFDRWLPPSLFRQWVDIVDQVYSFTFENENDIVSWKWGGKGRYNTKSVYDHLTRNDEGMQFQHIWMEI
jgi:hypothetical protein